MSLPTSQQRALDQIEKTLAHDHPALGSLFATFASVVGQEPMPARPAEKRVLIRRAYFDLIGLPPTPAQVDAFLADQSPDAFAKVVDGLLASPQYGQRWARHWLDVVRYTDSFDARGVGSAGDCAEDGVSVSLRIVPSGESE